MRRKVLWSVLLGLLWLQSAVAQFDSEEPLLTPGGFSTAETLRDGEWLLAPIPWGWTAYGATSRLTLAWDYPLALLGYPAGFIRYRAADFGKSHLALEAYGVWFRDGLTDERSKGYRLEHRGAQSWVRLDSTTSLSDSVDLHFYAGANYAEYSRYSPQDDGDRFSPVVYRRHWSPDAGAGLSWRTHPSMRVHVNYVYGNTFLFVDQVSRKRMITAQLHFAPFGPQRSAFLRNLRFDLSAFHVRVPDAGYEESLPLPIYPTVYWQWGGN